MANEPGRRDSAPIDPITFEVLRNTFIAVCNEMAIVVAKTAYSTAVNEGRDFAGALYDRSGKLVSQGEFDLPAFVGITQLTVPEVVRAIGLENMQPGDIYMNQRPLRGQHALQRHPSRQAGLLRRPSCRLRDVHRPLVRRGRGLSGLAERPRADAL